VLIYGWLVLLGAVLLTQRDVLALLFALRREAGAFALGH
jgi:hypothetical protein